MLQLVELFPHRLIERFSEFGSEPFDFDDLLHIGEIRRGLEPFGRALERGSVADSDKLLLEKARSIADSGHARKLV